MNVFEELEQNDVNITEGTARFLGNKEFYLSMIYEFSVYLSENNPGEAFLSDDCGTVLSVCHTLKGMTGNLSFSGLYRGYSEIVQLLRADRYEEAEKRYRMLEPLQNRILDIITTQSFKNS